MGDDRQEKKDIRVDVHKELANFSNFLKKEGYKITSQRLLVAEKIFRLQEHFTVDELAEELKDRKGEISRATIYRIVSLMVEAGQLVEHNFGENVKYYEHEAGHLHHDHILCMDCGHIAEFVDADIEKVQHEIAERHGFELHDHSLILHGRCKQLAANGHCIHRQRRENSNDSE